MLRTLLRRLLMSIPAVFIVSILTFVLTGLTPGDPATTILGTNATPAAVANLNKQLGLDRPLYAQYASWLANAFHGNFGTSVFTGQPVTAVLAASVPVTLTLIIGAVVVALVVGVPLGVQSARRAKSGGKVIDAVSSLGYAIPPFFLAVLLALIFSNVLNVLPASGFIPFGQSASGWARSLILPVATLGIPGAAIVARQTRQSVLEVIGRDFVRSLRARGLSESMIVYKHVLRNSLGNVVTLLGLYVVGMLLGTTLVETVFAMQGLGSVAVAATTQHNLPVLEGVALVFTVIVVVTFALVDVSRALLNPKLRTK